MSMPAEFNSSFDDSALKTAVRGVWGDEHAPEALRRRVGMIAASAEAPVRQFRLEFRWRQLAAAAVLVLGFGTLVFQFARLRPVTQLPPPRYAVTPALMQELIAHHDAQVSMAVRHGGTATDPDFTQLANQLKEKIHLTVMAADIGHDFKFEGASLFTLNNKIPVAQLSFQRGGETISVFSMPADVVPETRQLSRYLGRDDAHTLRGVVQNGGFYCIVGSGGEVAECGNDAGRALYALQVTFPPIAYVVTSAAN